MNRLPVHIYGFILHIGSSLSKTQKATTFNVPITPQMNLSYRKISLQLTLIQETYQWNDDLFASIRNYVVVNNSMLKITVDTHRSNSTVWGLHLKAHLLISIYETEMVEIGPVMVE